MGWVLGLGQRHAPGEGKGMGWVLELGQGHAAGGRTVHWVDTLQRLHVGERHPVGPLERLHRLPHKHTSQAWVVNTGVKGGQPMHQIVRHGCERQQGKGGRGVGVRHLLQLPACSPFLDLETLVPVKLEIVLLGSGQLG